MESFTRIGIFTFGVVVGIVGTRTYFKKKYKEVADEEIETYKEIFRKRLEKMVEEETEEKKEEEVVTGTYTPQGEVGTISYKDFYAHKKGEDTTVGKTSLMEDQDFRTIKPVEEEPYEIGVGDYEEDMEYGKVALNYYMEDGVLIFEESEEIAEDDQTVGIENLSEFVLADDQTAYFRNPFSCIDYEVIKIDGSYKELIAGNI